MAPLLEIPMALTYYGTIQGADDYNEAMGNTAWAALSTEAKTAALVRGTLYVDSYAKKWIGEDYKCWWTFLGLKSGGPAQYMQWPRTGIDGIDSATVPLSVEYATYEAAAIEGANPNSLRPIVNTSTAVKRERVDVLEVEYAISSSTNPYDLLPTVPIIDSLLAGLLVRRCTGSMAIYTV